MIDKTTCPECGNENANMETENGVVTNVYCKKCKYTFNCELENQGDDAEAWDAYPDGWTCQACSEVFAGIMPASTEDGTICKECVKVAKKCLKKKKNA